MSFYICQAQLFSSSLVSFSPAARALAVSVAWSSLHKQHRQPAAAALAAAAVDGGRGVRDSSTASKSFPFCELVKARW